MPQTYKTIILATSGSEFISQITKKEYVGLYRYELGIPYSGVEDTSDTARLYDIRFGNVYGKNAEEILSGGIAAKTYTQLNPRFGQHLNDPPPYKANPTEKDYSQSRMTRYFIKNLHTGKISEAEKLTYKLYKLKNRTLKNLYKAIKIEWKLTGPLEDVIDDTGAITITGIIQTNEKTMSLHKKNFPDFSLVIPPDDLAKITS